MKRSWLGVGLAALLLMTVRVGFAPAGAEQQAPPAPTGAFLTGTIGSASSERPIPGARIEVHEQLDSDASRQHRLGGSLPPEPLARATADAGGRFRVMVPFATRLYVVAEAPGHARSRYLRALYLPPGAGERDLGQLELPAGRRLTGKVLSPDGKPVKGATVVAGTTPAGSRRGGRGGGFGRNLMGRGLAASATLSATTGADGAFVLDSLPQRPVTLRAYADRMAPERIENLSAGGVITIRLTKGHQLSGKVVAPDGKSPVAGAWVMAGPEGLDGLTRSDAMGLFRFEHLRAGAVELIAGTPSGESATEATAMLAPSAPLPVTMPAKGEPRVLRLRPGGIVRARALDSESRLPLAGATLTLDTAGEFLPRLGVTGDQGEVQFAGIPLGDVNLRVEADRYLEEEIGPAAIGAGQTRTMTAALRLAASIEGTIRDATGRPIAGATISVAGPPPFALPIPIQIFLPIGVDPVESDKQGRFVLAGLPPKSELKVGVTSPGYVPWEMPGIKLRPGERRDGMEVLLDGGLMITGRLLDPEGQPVASAEISATRRREGGGGAMVIRMERRGPGGGRGGPGSAGDEALPAVTSGPDGVFRIRGARTGIWSLQISSKGHAPETVGGLKLEEPARSLDAGDIRLKPGALLRGHVVTSAGEPIPYARGSVRKEFAPLSEFTTGEDGSFVTDDLIPGEAVTLAVDADGYGSVEKAGLTPPVEDLEIAMTPASRVGGKVVDRETRRPITDFSISMSRSRGMGGGGMRMVMAMEGPETSFHTDDGTFVVEDVDPGKVNVTATAPGYRESAMRDLEVPAGQDLTDLTFLLTRAASISGTVMDERGQPVPDAGVSKKESSGGQGMMMRPGGGDGANTDGDGNFMLSGLDRGPMTLSISHQDFEPADIDVDTTQDIEGLKIKLSRGASLSGIVLHEEDGTPIARVSVVATAAGQDRFSSARNATTGPDGAFVIDAVSPGRYTLRAEATGLRPATLEGVVVTAGAPPPPIEIKLGGGVTLTGIITGLKEADLPQFTVRAMATGLGGFGTTAPVDSTGHFEMKGLPPGSLTLLAGSGMFGGKSTTKTVKIPEGVDTFETEIEFPRGYTVSGVVTRGGNPVDGATVVFMQEATRTSVSAQTGATGQYRAEDLDDGAYNISVMQFSTGLSHSLKATVKTDKELDIEVPVIRITGFVTDAVTGEPLDGATISTKKEGAAPSSAGGGFLMQQGASTDASGYYQVEGLEDGRWTLTARREGYGFESRTLTIVAGVVPGEVTFNLAPVDALSFRAIDSGSGLPIRSLGALVLTSGGDPLAPAGSGATAVFQGRLSADASGLFRLGSLQPGTYRLVLGGQGLATETLHDIRVPAKESTITIGPGGAIEVTAENLKTGETARALLLDGSGRPVHFNTFLPEPIMTLRAGAASTMADLKPGAYRLRVSMPGGGVAEKPVNVTAGATTPLTIP